VNKIWIVALAVLTLVLFPGLAAGVEFVLDPGTHSIEVHSQHFEIETEVTINLVFDFVDEYYVRGSVTVLDPIGHGWVTLTWIEAAAVMVDEDVDGSEDFSHRNSETGHAERKALPKFGPTIPQEPALK